MDREEDCKWGYGLDDQIRADRLPDTEILPEGMKKVRREDPEYPGRLRNIPDPPKQLYYYGELPGEDEPSAAIIGARDCSEYGKYVAIELGRLLGQNGICVISGMARGIDGISQEAALSVGGRSYGVLGSGADVCYPRSNRGLYEQLKCRGGVLSEYAPGTPAKGYLFPPRNRIVSGLADVVVVVVRYFGGIRLGTSGLIAAYREAARLALEAAPKVVRHVEASMAFTFPYVSVNDVMKLIKQPGVTTDELPFDNACSARVRIRRDDADRLRSRLGDVDGLTFVD